MRSISINHETLIAQKRGGTNEARVESTPAVSTVSTGKGEGPWRPQLQAEPQRKPNTDRENVVTSDQQYPENCQAHREQEALKGK